MTYLFVFAFTLALILPTLLVVWIGQRLLSRQPQPARNHSLVRYGLIAYLLIAIPYAAISFSFRDGSVSPLFLLIIPLLDGLLALLVINWRMVHEFWQAEKMLAALLLLLLLAVFLIAAFIDPALVFLLLVPPLLTGLIWAAGTRMRAGWLVAVAIIIIVILFLDALGIAGNQLIFSLEWLRNVYKLTSGLVALLAMILAAILIHHVYQSPMPNESSSQDGRQSGSRRGLYLMLAALLLLSVAVVTFRHGVLTNATGRAYEDHLPFATLAAGLISGLVLAFSRVDNARRLGTAYVLLATITVMVGYGLGWQVDYEAVNTTRASRLNKAITLYHQDTGGYPNLLADLTPSYLPVVLGPLTGRGQVWCYQSGPDFYRLGYVYFQRYYQYPDDTPFWEPYYEIKVPYTAGQLPQGEWICDQELDLFKQHGGL